MAVANSTTQKASSIPDSYYKFSRDTAYKINEIYSLVDCIRALSNEIDEGLNISVTISLEAIKDKLIELADEIDSTCYTYELKVSEVVQKEVKPC